jgi:hypothetical protein
MPTPLYNRTKQCFKVIAKRKTNKVTEDYGVTLIDCCETFLVLADNSGISWKNDITSAWYKTEFDTDTVQFKLYKSNGALATYQPTKKPFLSNPLDFYATINWSDVLSTDGAGCYEYRVDANIDGVNIPTLIWGEYQLMPYSSSNAQGTVRLSSVYNMYSSIENINFSGSKVKDTIRFFGFFGKKEPNMVIDNLIYQGRTIQNVQREILNTYEVNTDPIKENTLEQLINQTLLMSSELYISDHNFHNFTTSYKDLPVEVKESPTVEYFEYANTCKLKCILQDKNINTLSKFS